MSNITRPASSGKAKSTAARVGPHPKEGPPAYARKQEDAFAFDLEAAGEAGLNRQVCMTPRELGGRAYYEAARIVNSLEKRGYLIEHRRPTKEERDAGQKFVTYVLRGKPVGNGPSQVPARKAPDVAHNGGGHTELKAPASGWKAEGFCFGDPAKSSLGRKAPSTAQAGLFDGSVRPSDFVEREMGRKAGA